MRWLWRQRVAGQFSLVVHARSLAGLKRARSVVEAVVRELGVVDAVIAYYGLTKLAKPQPSPILYTEKPLQRGYAVASTTRLATAPLLVAVDAESRCFDSRAVAEAVEAVLANVKTGYALGPITTAKLRSVFSEYKSLLASRPGVFKAMESPMYTVLVAPVKYAVRYSFWFFEPFTLHSIASRAGLESVGFDNSCVDQLNLGFLEDYVVRDFRESVYKYFEARSIGVGVEASTSS